MDGVRLLGSVPDGIHGVIVFNDRTYVKVVSEEASDFDPTPPFSVGFAPKGFKLQNAGAGTGRDPGRSRPGCCLSYWVIRRPVSCLPDPGGVGNRRHPLGSDPCLDSLRSRVGRPMVLPAVFRLIRWVPRGLDRIQSSSVPFGCRGGYASGWRGSMGWMRTGDVERPFAPAPSASRGWGTRSVKSPYGPGVR